MRHRLIVFLSCCFQCQCRCLRMAVASQFASDVPLSCLSRNHDISLTVPAPQPENFLLTAESPALLKVADFGVAKGLTTATSPLHRRGQVVT